MKKKEVHEGEPLLSMEDGLYARRPVMCVPLNGHREMSAYVGQENTFPGPDNKGFCTLHRRVQIHTGERFRASADLEGTKISLGGHTDLNVVHGGTLTGVRYRDEILDPYVRPYAGAIGNDFILMDDNARPHRAVVVDLESHGLERMEGPAQTPDLNPREHLWDCLGRQVAALSPPPRSLDELEQGLLRVWSSLPI
ncbi:hypothetical protein AVEN_100930-1 [Araneus ventricosus]|uniref:Tc1-like transposase DDE domain-containing protein n=1 Tax=Araneus ventricosus TaxID=182803 RepID=A0A4Y2AWH7_ARAVE|nr:hypothetical protein AVEN_100930-1 [Araneus ventricosus]